MLYFSSFSAHDPYLAFSIGKKKYGVSHSSEFARMVSESSFDEVLLLSDVAKGASRRFKLPKGQAPNSSQLVRHLAKVYKIREFLVGARFPAGLGFELRDAGLKISVAPHAELLPQRTIKTPAEIELLRKANLGSAAGFRIVAKTLAESTVRRGKLIHQGKVLTAERLRELISQASLAVGAYAAHTITAAGDQACDCHNAGYGPIPANQLIVVDIFPRRSDDGYWGDMTRTFLKGQANDAQKRLVRTVKKSHELSLQMTKPGVRSGKVHEAVEAFFDKEGYESVKNHAQPKGFHHALGHGVGLEIHESPIIRHGSQWKFKKGMVMTVEPGLYYRGLGGVRIEDVIHLIPGGNELLSKAPYKWQIA